MSRPSYPFILCITLVILVVRWYVFIPIYYFAKTTVIDLFKKGRKKDEAREGKKNSSFYGIISPIYEEKELKTELGKYPSMDVSYV